MGGAIDPDDLKAGRVKREQLWAAYQASLETQENAVNESKGKLGARTVSIGGVSEIKIENVEIKCDFSKTSDAKPTAKPISSQSTKEKQLFNKTFNNL